LPNDESTDLVRFFGPEALLVLCAHCWRMPFVWVLIDSGLARMKNVLIAFEVFGPTCSE
jgi:hypothetical protein